MRMFFRILSYAPCLLGIRHELPATVPLGQTMGLTTNYGPSELTDLELHRWYTYLVYPQYHICQLPTYDSKHISQRFI
jgi:hypothetical protein